jgi:hypothetical protein
MDRMRTVAAWIAVAMVAAAVAPYACCERPARPSHEDVGRDPATRPLPPPVAAPAEEADAGATLIAMR